MRLLLNDERVDVNKPLDDGTTPLELASAKGHTEIVKLLSSNDRIEIKKEDQDQDIQSFFGGQIQIMSLSRYEQEIEKEKQEENISQSLQNDEQPINQILLTGEFLKLGKGMLKQWQPRVFDLRLQSLAWKKYQNVNIFFSFFFEKEN